MKRSGVLRRTQMQRGRARLRTKPRPGWATVKAMVLVRDKWRCRVCHDWAADVHHVQKRSTGGKARRPYLDSPENLISLCRSCHTRTDAPYALGRLVIQPLGLGKFQSEIVYASDKFAAREMNGDVR